MTEDFCGVPMDISVRQTARGTEYKIGKWICPTCGKANSYMELDNEWSHGDGLVISYRNGELTLRCSACWLHDREKP